VPLAYFAETWGLWLRTLLVVVLATGLLLMLTRGGAPSGVRRLLARSLDVPRAVFLALRGVAAAMEAALVALLVFDRGAESMDAWIQLFQARVFLSGALVAPPPPSIGHFATLHALITPRGWCSQYPPLHAALLAVGLAAGRPWLMTPVLAAFLPSVVHLLGRRTGDERIARLAAALVLLSPFVVAIDASAMNHLRAALAVAVGLWSLADLAAGRTGAGLVCGAAAGVLLGLRPLEGGLLAALGGLALLGALRRGSGWGAIAAAAVAGVVCLAPTLAYNAATTGNPLTFTYSALWGSGLRLGLEHGVPWGHPLTFLRALAYTATDAHQLGVYLLEWPLPVTVLAAAGLWLGRDRVAAGLRPAAAWVLAPAGALFFHFHRDVLYGPRFLFSAVPALLVLVAAGLVGLADVRRPLGARSRDRRRGARRRRRDRGPLGDDAGSGRTGRDARPDAATPLRPPPHAALRGGDHARPARHAAVRTLPLSRRAGARRRRRVGARAGRGGRRVAPPLSRSHLLPLRAGHWRHDAGLHEDRVAARIRSPSPARPSCTASRPGPTRRERRSATRSGWRMRSCGS
jgi:hypothetical protein